MAKKKKTTEQPVEKLPAVTTETEQQKNNKPAETSLAYAGTVTVKAAKGTQVISNKTYHNAGMPRLFKFFAKCITGDYGDAKLLQPQLIQLGINSHATPSEVTGPMDGFTACSELILKRDSGVEISGDISKAVIYFRVFGQSLSALSGINELLLFDKSGSAGGNAPSAYILLTNGTSWDPINNITANTMLYIDWELQVGNS